MKKLIVLLGVSGTLLCLFSCKLVAQASEVRHEVVFIAHTNQARPESRGWLPQAAANLGLTVGTLQELINRGFVHFVWLPGTNHPVIMNRQGVVVATLIDLRLIKIN